MMVLPVINAHTKSQAHAESAHTVEPTVLSSTVETENLGAPLTVEDVTVHFGFEEKVNAQVSPLFKPYVFYSYDESLISIKNGVVRALVNQPMTVPVTASLIGGYSCTFNVIVKTDASLQEPGTILTNYDRFFAEYTARPFETDQMTFFVGDSFFDLKWFFTDFYTRFAGKNAACLGVGSTKTWQWYWVGQKLYRYQPENIVAHIGTNDLHAAGATVESVYESIVKMFSVWHENMPETNIYWFTVEPRLNENANRANISRFNSQVSAWAADKDWLTVIDSFTPFAENIDNASGNLYKDSVHVKCPEGYDKMMELALAAGLEISNNDLHNIEFAEQSFSTDKNAPHRQFIGETTGAFVYETTIQIEDCKNLFDHIAFDTVGSGDDRLMLWNSEYDGKFRFEGYFEDTDYKWINHGRATHCAQKGDTVKVAILRTEKHLYLFVNDALECVLLNADLGEELSVYTQSVSATFTNCYFDNAGGSLYTSYAQKAEIAPYENSAETEKVFHYDLAE